MAESIDHYELLTWDDNLSVGVPEMDGEHQVLVGLYNDAARGFAAGCGREEKRKLLNELDTYAFYHFGMEEALMRVCRYPKAREHGGEHARFRRELAELKAELDGAANSTGDEDAFEQHALTFIRTWISRHIQGSDKALGAFLAEAAARWSEQRPVAAD
ncbi:bacteriohemerythrin [Azospirillum sp. TSO22-1]|uniref:bacteriohemerythrin n=1 Tax=Azospirillum sp. TSO22-1 TaxID=716789 RepID=UPI0013047FE6|nr:bacteriohemerythrin [Azospirillum sp. TSO22-1]